MPGNISLEIKDTIFSSLFGIKETIKNFPFSNNPFWILDIIIVAVLIYWLFVVIRETRAIKILYGIFILIAVYLFSSIFNLLAVNWIVRQFILMLMVAIPIVFQPELRRTLEKLGQTKLFGQFATRDQAILAAQAIVSAVATMTEKKIGGLIVIKRKAELKEIIATGSKIDANISTDLLLNIFFPKSPLHDGAVIIGDGRILAAGCTLPISETKPATYGLRHRAAIGLSEQTDAVTIVVSEEKGTISFVKNGTINQHLTPQKIEKLLANLFRIKEIDSDFKKTEV